MERILVPILKGTKDTWLLNHGLQLARLVGGTLFILEIGVMNEDSDRLYGSGAVRVPVARGELAARIRDKEVDCEYFQMTGEFCEGIFRFCDQHRITKVVLGHFQSVGFGVPEKMHKLIKSLASLNTCQVELVRKK